MSEPRYPNHPLTKAADAQAAREGMAEAPQAKEEAAPLAASKGKRKPSARKAGSAWAKRNAEYLGRRSETIEFFEQALAIWRKVRELVEDERRYGKSGGIGKPGDLRRAAPMVGDSIERQVYDRVEHERLTLGPSESLADRIEAWPLPATFWAPVPPLCDADVAALARQEREEAIREAEEERAREEKASGDDHRLLPGFEREQ